MKNGHIHSIALVQIDTRFPGHICHLRDGRLHRIGGPAAIGPRGAQQWHRNGLFHREDGPAYIYGEREEWCFNDFYHRDGGPAITCPNGDQLWYQHGSRHRIDGPAVIRGNGDEEFWLNGVQLSQEEFEERMNR